MKIPFKGILGRVLGDGISETKFNKMAEEVRKDERDKIAVSLKENGYVQLAKNVREKGPDYAEKTREGFPFQQHLYWKHLGEYNPDEIPLQTYDKMRWDGQIMMGMAALKLPIISRTYWIECENEKVKWFVHSAFRDIWRGILKSSLIALDYGFSAHEKVWDVNPVFRVTSDMVEGKYKVNFDTAAILLKKIKSLHPFTITMKYDEKQNFDGFIQNKDDPNLEADLKAEKAFVFTHNKEWGNIYGWSRLKPVYPYWYAYWVINAWHERWLGRRGVPPIVVKHPPGSSQYGENADGTPAFRANADIAKEVVSSLNPDSIITMPSTITKDALGSVSGWEISLLNDTSNALPYVEAMVRLDTMKLRSLLVPERSITQDVTVGSYSMADAHVWVLMETLKGLMADLTDHYNKYLVTPLLEYNFGENAPKARLVMEEVGRELSNALFEIYRQMVVTGRAIPSIRKMEELLGIPSMSKEEKEEVEERQTEMMKLQGGGAMGGRVGGGQYGNPYDNVDVQGALRRQQGGGAQSFLSEQAVKLAESIDAILMKESK